MPLSRSRHAAKCHPLGDKWAARNWRPEDSRKNRGNGGGRGKQVQCWKFLYPAGGAAYGSEVAPICFRRVRTSFLTVLSVSLPPTIRTQMSPGTVMVRPEAVTPKIVPR